MKKKNFGLSVLLVYIENKSRFFGVTTATYFSRQRARFTIRNTCDSTKIAVILNGILTTLHTRRQISAVPACLYLPPPSTKEKQVSESKATVTSGFEISRTAKQTPVSVDLDKATSSSPTSLTSTFYWCQSSSCAPSKRLFT